MCIANLQVQLAPYSDDGHVDISMFWTMLEEVYSQGFHQIATLVIDGLKGNCKEGTIVGVDPSHYTYMDKINDNQLWKILPIGSCGNSIDRPTMAEMKILSKDGDNLYVSIRGSEIVLAREDPNDKTQVHV